MDILAPFRKQNTPDESTNPVQIITLHKHIINTCADIIANIVSNCEFITYEKGELCKNFEYFKFNYEPNITQNANKFWYDVAFLLITKSECLVIEVDTKLYICDSFTKDYETKTFTDIVVDDEELPDKNFGECFYFSLASNLINQELQTLMKQYDEVLSTSVNSFKERNTLKFWVSSDGFTSVSKTGDSKRESFSKKFKSLINPKSTVITSNAQNKPEFFNISQTANDIEKLNQNIVRLVSMAWHVPLSVLIGDSTWNNEQINTFLTFTLRPICKMIETEINRVYYKQDKVLCDTKVVMDCTNIKHIDILEKASSLEALARISFSHNDLLKILGKPNIKEDWANDRLVTKNYEFTENLSKGGEKNE